MSSHSRLATRFAQLNGRTALVPYITAGDPSPEATPALMHALVEAGADIIELGVPFSEPMADGPVSQRAAERAIEQGTSLSKVLALVAAFRQDDQDTPVVLMGYANPIERLGQAQFAQQAATVGIDGLLVVDYPHEESDDFVALLQQHQIDPIYLLAPTSTPARIAQIGKLAKGYVYYVSLKGVTGAATLDTQDVATHIDTIREHVHVPVGVGFGIRDAESAQQLAQCADAIIIGSKLIETMEQAMQHAQAEGQPTPQAEQAAITAAATWLHSIRKVL